MKTAVIYARVSSSNDRQNTQRQIEDLTQFASRNEYQLILGVSVYIQNLGIHTLQPNGEVNPVASIMVTVLAEMANIERSNIVYRLNSGRESYIKNGGKLGCKVGSVKTTEQKREQYKEVISLLKKGCAIRNVAKLGGVSTSTIQRIKKEFTL